MPAPIDPSFLSAAGGPEWNIGSLDAAPAPDAALGAEQVAPAGDSFGSLLGKQIQNLSDVQNEAATQSAALASGTASDPSSVVMAVEKARLSMQLAAQLRTKGVEALNEIFHTKV